MANNSENGKTMTKKREPDSEIWPDNDDGDNEG